MAPKSKKKQQNKAAQRALGKRSRPLRVTAGVRHVLDKAAAEWATLMNDPCNAKLTYGCYPSGTSGSVLIRVEADTIVANGATEVAAYGAFAPGMGAAFLQTAALTSDGFGSVCAPSSALTPGQNLLGTGEFEALRCVAACTQLSYPGTELNRSGIVGIGVTPGGLLEKHVSGVNGGGNINTTAGNVRMSCQHVERMPSSLVECKWFPGDRDSEALDTTFQPATTLGPSLEGRNIIVWSASGFPVSTGVRVRNVAVYEVSLAFASGTVSAIAPPVSNNTPNQVLKALADWDPQWYLRQATKFIQGAGSFISYASQGVKAAGRLVNGVGLMLA